GSGADVPDPAAAGVSASPVPASRIPCSAAAGTSDPALGCLYSERWVAPQAEDREDGRVCWSEQRCYCYPGDAAVFPPDGHLDLGGEYKPPPPLSPEPLRGG